MQPGNSGRPLLDQMAAEEAYNEYLNNPGPTVRVRNRSAEGRYAPGHREVPIEEAISYNSPLRRLLDALKK